VSANKVRPRVARFDVCFGSVGLATCGGLVMATLIAMEVPATPVNLSMLRSRRLSLESNATLARNARLLNRFHLL
jgi:hypothetical protein